MPLVAPLNAKLQDVGRTLSSASDAELADISSIQALPAQCGSSLPPNDAAAWLCEYPGPTRTARSEYRAPRVQTAPR
jgi:hypothetical protein